MIFITAEFETDVATGFVVFIELIVELDELGEDGGELIVADTSTSVSFGVDLGTLR